MSARPRPALIALDLDGTFLDTSGRPLDSTVRAIEAALDRGSTVALASGRDPWALRLLAERAGLDPARLVYIGLDGASIVEGVSGEVMWSASIERPLLRELMTHLRGFAVTASIPAGPVLYVEDAEGFNVDYEASANGQRVHVVARLEDAPVTAHKVLVSAPPPVLAAERRRIAAPFTGRLAFVFAAPTHLECLPPGVDKGSALRHYCEVSGIDLADTVAFGDHENDLAMIRAAGLGVAMGNALEEVKAGADVVTADNDSHGIALVLRERFGLG